MTSDDHHILCPQCSDPAAFSKKCGKYFCAECEREFDAPAQAVEPQTIFLSYAHRSEREEDFDVLVLEEFARRLSLQACLRVLCRISASQWRAGARVLDRSCISLARQRSLVEGRADFVDRFDRIRRHMDSGDFHG